MSARNVTFFFGDRRITAAEGDSIAKALFDAGVRTLSYSVKYKRPRGVHCARGRCVMCHMEVDGVPGVPTCITPVRDGMRVRRENFRPFFAPLLIAAARVLPFPAGFYYRMFTRPTAIRRLFLGTLRRMAGVGRVTPTSPTRPAPRVRGAATTPEKAAYDVVVVGAGLSGMAAAVAAARRGASVLLVDEYATPGGHSIGFQTDTSHAATRDELAASVAADSSIEWCARTTAQGFYPPDELLLGPGGSVPNDGMSTMLRVRASTFIFATGGYDVVPLFENSDTPGIFGTRGLRLLLERDHWRPGTRAVLYGSGDELAGAAQLLRHHDIDIAAVVDAGESPPGGFENMGVHSNARIESAHGGAWLRAVRVAGAGAPIRCDLLCTAFSAQGAYELPYQAGFRFEMSKDDIQENKVMLPTENHRQVGDVFFQVVGELAGHRMWKDIVASGDEAGSRLSLGSGSQQAS